MKPKIKYYCLFLLMSLSFIFLGGSVFLLLIESTTTAAFLAQVGSLFLLGSSIFKSAFL